MPASAAAHSTTTTTGSRVIGALLEQVEELKRRRAELLAAQRSKPVLAVDIDEVLGAFLPALIRWHNDTHGTSLSLGDFNSYWFCEVWGGTNEEATEKVHAFFETPYFLQQLEPIQGAAAALETLSAKFDMVVVTSRQHVIAEATMQWLEQHFPSSTSRFLLFAKTAPATCTTLRPCFAPAARRLS